MCNLRQLKFISSERHTHRCPDTAATEASVQSEVDVIPTEMEWEMVCMDPKALKQLPLWRQHSAM